MQRFTVFLFFVLLPSACVGPTPYWGSESPEVGSARGDDGLHDEELAPPEDEEPTPPDEKPQDPLLCDTDDVFPVPTWPTALPESHGLDPAGLQIAAELAEANRSNCLLVVRHGHIVGEWYWQETTPTTKVKNWSVGKSYASTVVGLALDRGDLTSVDERAADWIPEWEQTPREAIRLHDLLSMSSGLEFDMIADNVTMPLADNMTALAIESPLVNPPGALWEYNNHSVQSMEPILRAATGMAADEYADQHLFSPLGMDVEWKRDEVEQPALYMNARTSCRDNARFGLLFLRNGCWNGERVLSKEWVEAATSPSTSLNRGYGYWWWLNGEEPILDSVDFEPKSPGGMHSFAPDDAFCAVGLGNQFIEVIPSLDLVVVRMGTAPQDVPGAWADPIGMLQEAAADGQQLLHNAVLEEILDSVLE